MALDDERPTLTEDQIRILLDDAFESIQIEQTLEKFGRQWTRRMLAKFFKDNPAVKAQYDQALIDACVYIENDLLNVHRRFDGKQGSHKIASVWSNNAMRILEARSPDKYGKKIDVKLNDVSVRSNLDQSNERLRTTIRDVTPQLAEIANRDRKEKK